SGSRRIIDQKRSEASRASRGARVAFHEPASTDANAADDSLLLLFMCCHPALTAASAIALTLRAVGGLTTPQIANAFLVPEATMAQRISRAKATIKASGVPFAMPSPEERSAPLGSALHALYLISNAGS